MKRTISLSAAVIFAFQVHAQDQRLANPVQSLLNINPSFAGSNGYLRDQFAYRSAMLGESGNAVTCYNSLDAYVKPLHGGLALSGMSSDYSHGTIKNSNVNLIYAPHLECKETGFKVIPSVQLSWLHSEMDPALINYIQTGVLLQWPSGSYNYHYSKDNLDLSAGLLVNYKSLYIGASVFHINQPDIGILGASKLPARFNVNASYNYILSKYIQLNFTAIGSQQQKYTSAQFALNALVSNHIIAGVGFIVDDAALLNLGYKNNFLSATVGYGINLNRLSGYNATVIQAGLGLNFHKKGTLKAVQNTDFEKW